MSAGKHFLTGMILFAVVVFALAVRVELQSQPAVREPVLPDVCMDEETREHARGVMFDALDSAFKSHTVHMFEVWMKDPRGQPERARAGMRQGMEAYVRARDGARKWNPKPC